MTMTDRLWCCSQLDCDLIKFKSDCVTQDCIHQRVTRCLSARTIASVCVHSAVNRTVIFLYLQLFVDNLSAYLNNFIDKLLTGRCNESLQ